MIGNQNAGIRPERHPPPPSPSMPNKTVQVSFAPPDGWSFVPHVTPMKRPGKVTLVKEPKDAPWEFVTAAVINGGSHFTVTPDPRAKRVVIDNHHDVLGTFTYTVTVALDHTPYTSPARDDDDDPARRADAGESDTEEHVARPPQIQNDP